MEDWQRLVTLLLDGLGDEVAKRGRPVWVFIAPDPKAQHEDGFVLGLSEEPNSLMGGLAPPEWRAVGVVATGRAIGLDQGATKRTTPSGRGRKTTLRMSLLVTRDDEAYCKAVTSDGLTIEEAPAMGGILDSLRTCLGLPPVPSSACAMNPSGLDRLRPDVPDLATRGRFAAPQAGRPGRPNGGGAG